jgi:hypothetical protein
MASTILPPSLLSPLITTVTTLFGVLKTAQTHLSPLILRLTTQPDIASILVLIAVLFVSFKILGMAYRAIMFWVYLVFRLAFWIAIGLTGYWVYTRGVDGFVEDVTGLAEYWSGEYEKYSGEVKRYKGMQEGRLRAQTRTPKGKSGW